MNKEEALVSVISPCFNRGSLIKEMIDSLINQTYTNWELLLVDDGSDESTIEVLYEYQNKDKRIKLFFRNSSERGACVCRNIGLQAAKGDYLIFLDSDDFLSSYALEQRVKYIENHNLDFAIFKGAIYRSQDDIQELIIKNTDDIIPSLLSLSPYCLTGTTIIKRESLITNGINWDIHLKGFQDIDFHLSLCLSNLKYHTATNLPLDFFWRKHNQGNIGKNLCTFEQITSHAYLYKKLYIKICSIENLRSKYKKKLQFLGGKFLTRSFLCEDRTAPFFLLSTMQETDKDFCKIRKWLFVWSIKNYCKHRLLVRSILFLFHPVIFAMPSNRLIRRH